MCGFYINHFRGRFQLYSAFVQVGPIAHHTDLSVCVYSDGLYLQSPMNAAKLAEYKDLVWLVINGEDIAGLFSGLHNESYIKN